MNMTADKLMELVNNKYKNLKLAGTWNVPSPTEEKIVALESKINKMSKDQKNLNKRTPFKEKGGNDETFNKSEKPTWLKKNTPPDANSMKKPRKWGTIQWYWCDNSTGDKKCGGQWRAHKPDKCKGLKGGHKRKTNDEKSGKKKDKDCKTKSKPSLKLAAAYQVIMDSQQKNERSESESDDTDE
jgi:hypothetical protein